MEVEEDTPLGAKPKRVMQISDSAGWRYRFNPIADKDREALHDRLNPTRVALKLALFDAAAAANNGVRCAADTTWRNI